MSDLGLNQILRKVDFLTIRLFVTIVEEGNFLRAAERENIAPSAVSRRIQDLELHLGTPLLIRGTRAAQPTAAGEEFVRFSRSFLQSFERLVVRFDRQDGRVSGTVSVWASASSLMPVLARRLKDFRAAYPDTDLRVSQKATADILRGVASGEADIGLCPLGHDRPEGIIALPVFSDHLCAVVPDGFDLPGPGVAFADLVDLPLIALPPDTSLMRQLDLAAHQLGRGLNRAAEVMNINAASFMACEGFGIAILPDTVIPTGLPGGIRVLPLTDSWARREFGLHSRDPGLLSNAALALRTRLERMNSARLGQSSAQADDTRPPGLSDRPADRVNRV